MGKVRSPRRTSGGGRFRPFIWMAWLGLVALLPVGALAEPPSPPPFFAIENVHVVTGTGEVLESGTVLVADGLISAVGPSVTVPADAWVIDGEGMMLFPGLFDAMTPLGIAKEEEESDGGGSPFANAMSHLEPEDRPLTTPWLSAADELDAAAFGDDGKAGRWREAGFTSVVATPEEGIFAGQAAVVNLGRVGEDDYVRSQVVAANVAHRIGFERQSFGSFPSSLMGVLAYVKQIVEDTDHYAATKAAYAVSPRGMARPTYDRTLEPVEAARDAGTRSCCRPSCRARSIAPWSGRRVRLNAVIYGAHGAYQRVDELAAAGTPVLLSLDWPDEETDVDPEADTPIRTLYHRRMAPRRRRAGRGRRAVRLLLGGLSASELFKGVRAAVDAGLSNEDALAGLTSGPAAIFGVDDQLGTIERARSPTWCWPPTGPGPRTPRSRPSSSTGASSRSARSEEPTEPPAQDVSGTWAITMTTPRARRR